MKKIMNLNNEKISTMKCPVCESEQIISLYIKRREGGIIEGFKCVNCNARIQFGYTFDGIVEVL